VSLAAVLAAFTPGDQWSWDQEEADILSHPCVCVCGMPGCYQRRLEAFLAGVGRVEQGVYLGPDGRVWDGHHRIVAARRLGFADVPLEDGSAAPVG
jgi:hypothetical protein